LEFLNYERASHYPYRWPDRTDRSERLPPPDRSDGTAPLYITGDTVWYDGVAEVARRFRPGAILLFAGCARTRGPFNLTMDANDAIETAHAFPDATIVPIHRDGWAHFTQNAKHLGDSFKALGIDSRLLLLEPGVPTPITAS
jgi:hypothetical protein